ncbi:PIN domain-containing protein [Kitasatospora sp. NPDC001095]
MSELAPAVRRTLYQREQLRRALLDTSVLTTDIIAATKRPDPSSFVAGARARTVRCLIPAHVWDEVPRVLADRHREGGRFDLGRALELWQSRYAPVLYVVDTTNLPMTPQGEVLADRDASDVPMLLLADVIAPVVLIGTDKDLVASGLADADWAALRKALGDVGVTEGRMADIEQQAEVLMGTAARALGHGLAKIGKSTPKQLAVLAAVGAGAAGALYWLNKKHPRVPAQRPPMLPVLMARASKEIAALTERHARGEDRWQQAERGTPGDTLLHRVARTLVGSRAPLTRTQIVERLGEDIPGAGHAARMAAVLEVLTSYAMFVEVKGRGRWQVGRLGDR